MARERGASIRLEAIWKRYGDVTAVRDVTVEVAAGEFFTLLGPSGSGKTTLLQTIAGFALPSRGEVYIDGRAVSRIPAQHRNLGMVFQSYALFPHLTVFENVAFPLRVRRLGSAEIRQRVEAALALVRLEGFGPRLPRQLSGGQQQRVALARALVFEPRALLMDEPLGALDKKLREEMQGELKQLQRQLGATFVYVTHDQDEALRISDRIAVMRHGVIEQVGPPPEMYDDPATLFVADFLGESNFVRGVAGPPAADGTVAIRTDAGGSMRGVSRAALPSGARVVATIRPERLVFDDHDDPEAPAGDGPDGLAAAGVLEDAVYAGDARRWRVRTAHHGALVVKEQNAPARRPRQVGEAVVVRWLPADVRVFPEDPPP
jgi:spermidine/putrescine ABC transporter ATP-binding subunit